MFVCTHIHMFPVLDGIPSFSMMPRIYKSNQKVIRNKKINFLKQVSSGEGIIQKRLSLVTFYRRF